MIAQQHPLVPVCSPCKISCASTSELIRFVGARADGRWADKPQTASKIDLLVSYQRGRYGRAKEEILRVLKRLGDQHPMIDRTAVDGIAGVRTALNARRVVRGCRELLEEGFDFKHAVKWVPVDYWCEADLDAMHRLLAGTVRDQIAATETWGLKIAKHRWERYHTRDIIAHLAGAIDRKVDLDHPDKLVRADVVGNEVGISILRPGEVFSATAIPAPQPDA